MKHVIVKRDNEQTVVCGQDECGEIFHPKRSTQAYCSSQCRITANNNKRKSTRDKTAVLALSLKTKKSRGENVQCDGVTSQLAQCSNPVYVNGTNRPGGKKNRQRYCSDNCRQRSSRLRRKHGVATNQQLYTGKAVLI